MNLQTVINSRFGVSLAMGLCRILPPRMGYRFAYFLADRISGKRQVRIVRATRSNQWVVADEKISMKALNQLVSQTFRNAAYSIYNLYHHLGQSEKFQALIADTTHLDEIITHSQKKDQGLIIAGTHLGNFDLVSHAAALRGIKMIGLGWHQPGGGYRLQNRLRRKIGFDVYPASLASIRMAVDWLREKGTLITGLDRPVPESKYHPRFFNRPAALPVIHIQLALKTHTPVVVVGSRLLPDGKYMIEFSDPVVMETISDRIRELIYNAERCLVIAENFIRQTPDQWSMFYPVWPEVLDQIT